MKKQYQHRWQGNEGITSLETPKLSEAEYNALELLNNISGGSLLTSSIPEKNEKDVFGNIQAGIKAYLKLEAKGLVMITEEDPIELEDEEIFQFTNEVYITDLGKEFLAKSRT